VRLSFIPTDEENSEREAMWMRWKKICWQPWRVLCQEFQNCF
jgi:hypothetical protein